MTKTLIDKYNIPTPRYTSYPTVPYWDQECPSAGDWEGRLKQAYLRSNDQQGIALYLHLPFCESLCTFCGCNKRITRNHKVEEPYMQHILEEWGRYLALFETTPLLSELHLGGGTPTFFKPENLQGLIRAIHDTVRVAPNAEMSFEGHPNSTSLSHLQVLYDLGFRRVSFGIQDFDPKVQHAIHRIQPADSVERVTLQARELGYTSINYDLVFGLPFQTPETMERTVAEVIRLRPDRIAFYSYAHVPWAKPGQRAYDENDLPDGEAKRQLYEYGREQFERHGYREIGMDHFALPDDSLFNMAGQGKLNRNFMGYTTTQAEVLIGLGVSAISDCGTAYIQNDKSLESWANRLEEGNWPFFKGHLLSQEDLILRKHIQRLICEYETNWLLPEQQCEAVSEALPRLLEMQADGLVQLEAQRLVVTEMGKKFIRNICTTFDARMWRSLPQTQIFSKTV